MFMASARASTHSFYTSYTECNVSASDIVLDAGTDGTAYVIPMNKTWAEVNMTGTSTETYYECVLNITNLSSSINYTVKLENTSTYNISRLTNFTVYFHNGAISKQIEISNGSVIQSSGSWYSLSTLATIYISIAIKVSTSDSSTVDLRLHNVASGTTSPEIIQTVTINVN
jgi:hypothetical protein